MSECRACGAFILGVLFSFWVRELVWGGVHHRLKQDFLISGWTGFFWCFVSVLRDKLGLRGFDFLGVSPGCKGASSTALFPGMTSWFCNARYASIKSPRGCGPSNDL